MPKKSNGVRPIAVGETLRRLAATSLLRSTRSSLPTLARQFIVRTDGCVTVANIVRSAIENFKDACVVTIDLRNAFNSVSRDAVLLAVDNTQLSPYAQWAYGHKSRLRFKDITLQSSTGVQQGDPAGPVLFAFALNRALCNLREQFPNDMFYIWYADDGYIIGKQDSVVTVFNMLIDPLKAIGLNINTDKCALWSQSHASDRDIPGVSTVVINDSDTPLTVLGFPVAGNLAALEYFARTCVTKTEAAISPLASLNHAQGESIILRMCGPTSRLQHLFRFSLQATVASKLTTADSITLKHFERIAGRPLPVGWETIAASPIGRGGIGLALLSDIDQRAVSTSAVETAARVANEVCDIDRHQGQESGFFLEVLRALKNRHSPTENLVVANRQASEGSPARLQIVVESSASPHASAFLTAMPGPQTTLSTEEFRDAVWFRFGLPSPSGHHECTPDPAHDPLGLHRLGCRNAASARTHRHDDMVSVVASAALNADPLSFQIAREERLIDAEDSCERPGDVALNLGNGRTLADLTVALPFGAARQTSYRLAGSPAAAASDAYDRKISKWQKLLDDHELDGRELVSYFQPLAVTALGVWDERFLLWLRRFSDVCAASLGTDKGSAFADLMTRLSVALWRGNSRLLRALRAHRDPAD